MSNTTQEFSTFKRIAVADKERTRSWWWWTARREA